MIGSKKIFFDGVRKTDIDCCSSLSNELNAFYERCRVMDGEPAPDGSGGARKRSKRAPAADAASPSRPRTRARAASPPASPPPPLFLFGAAVAAHAAGKSVLPRALVDALSQFPGFSRNRHSKGRGAHPWLCASLASMGAADVATAASLLCTPFDTELFKTLLARHFMSVEQDIDAAREIRSSPV